MYTILIIPTLKTFVHPLTVVVSWFTYFLSESPTVTEPQINVLDVQADLEEIVFKSKMLCDHARNPFTSEQLMASSSEDVIQHISEEKGPFSVQAVNNGACSQRKLPHGHGSLKTVTGKVIYSGEWQKGEMISSELTALLRYISKCASIEFFLLQF